MVSWPAPLIVRSGILMPISRPKLIVLEHTPNIFSVTTPGIGYTTGAFLKLPSGVLGQWISITNHTNEILQIADTAITNPSECVNLVFDSKRWNRLA